MALDWKAWAALAIFVGQNAAASLLMRWNKSVAPVYSNSVAVLMQELAVKLPLSFVLYAWDTGGAPFRSIREDLRERGDEWAKLSIPALFYTVQNIMMYVGYANLEAAVGMVTYQTKIIFSAQSRREPHSYRLAFCLLFGLPSYCRPRARASCPLTCAQRPCAPCSCSARS